MRYREMIKKVQDYSGFSDSESENALITFVKLLARRLTPDERMDFASQLPAELQDTAIMTEDEEELSEVDDQMDMEEMLETIAEEQNIDEGHAKKQIMAAWNALKDALSPGEIDDIRSQLPKDMVSQLH